jgi:L-cysteine desulfidase
MCHHEVGFLEFAVVVSSGLLIEAPGKLSRLGKSPGQILVAVFPVAATFTFAVTGPFGTNFSAIGSIVADLRGLGSGFGLGVLEWGTGGLGPRVRL